VPEKTKEIKQVGTVLTQPVKQKDDSGPEAGETCPGIVGSCPEVIGSCPEIEQKSSGSQWNMSGNHRQLSGDCRKPTVSCRNRYHSEPFILWELLKTQLS
jgi:hypothetical protein